MLPRKRVLSVTAAAGLALGALAVAAPTHAFAGNLSSTACEDNSDDVPILGGPNSLDPNAPITLGVEVGIFGSPTSVSNLTSGHYALCYSTSPYGYSGPETTGGEIALDAADTTYSNPMGNTVNVACNPDSNPQGVALSCSAGSMGLTRFDGQPRYGAVLRSGGPHAASRAPEVHAGIQS